MKILFTICGRAGSKGIKNKNIRSFMSKPLPLYTLSVIDLFLKRNQAINGDIILNTDSFDLISIFKQNKMTEVKVINRKEELAGDSVGKIDVIRDCLQHMESEGNQYDMVLDLDITAPLRTVDDLTSVFYEQKTGHWDVVFTVVEARRNPFFNMVKKNEDGSYAKVITSEYTARQQAPEIFDMNASIYAYKPEFLKQDKQIFQGVCGAVKMEETGILDLDRENDFELMEIMAKYFFFEKEKFREIYDNIKW